MSLKNKSEDEHPRYRTFFISAAAAVAVRVAQLVIFTFTLMRFSCTISKNPVCDSLPDGPNCDSASERLHCEDQHHSPHTLENPSHIEHSESRSATSHVTWFIRHCNKNGDIKEGPQYGSPEKQIASSRVSVVFLLCMFFIIFSK